MPVPDRTLALPGGGSIPVFGLGTWRMGEQARRRAEEADAIRWALDLGVRLIDTAEMYGEGGAEEVIGEAIAGRRDGLFLVSKVYPHHAGRRELPLACERSLRRLRTERLDLYLIHWRGSVPLEESFAALERLREQGKIAAYGVSNFDVDDLEEMATCDCGLSASNQILYSLARREAEWAVLPWCRQRGIPVMAYCPLDQGRLVRRPELRRVADRLGATPAQVALAWLLAQDGVAVIPKSSSRERLQENVGACQVRLDAAASAELDRAFPPPRRPARLGII